MFQNYARYHDCISDFRVFGKGGGYVEVRWDVVLDVYAAVNTCVGLGMAMRLLEPGKRVGGIGGGVHLGTGKVSLRRGEKEEGMQDVH